jgi:hypothetical protein
MPLNAFIVRPFGVKEVQVDSAETAARLEATSARASDRRVVASVQQKGPDRWAVHIDFDVVHRLLFEPVMRQLNIRGETTEAVVKAGNIREDMFNRLVTADLVVADLTLYNPNVYYELGVRQAFRDKYTFLARSDLTRHPFDLQTDRYFDYDLAALAKDPESVVKRMVSALRATLNSTEADSPIFKLLPQLESEDRARFITVPQDFREEVEWARHQLRGEHLSMMAVECQSFLWEIEGLRLVGRAQFECNFIEAARCTWERVVARYHDDVEANSVLSTVYQRMNDAKKSEQALSRVARVRSLTPTRLSQVRSLHGRNLKATWTEHWRKQKASAEDRQRAALRSPLLDLAFDAFLDAFKLDLNNSYAGLNALTMLLVQIELAERFPEDWKSIQPCPRGAARALEDRVARLRPLISALQLAVESDRERLQNQGQTDPWFLLLEAAVACIVSSQPEFVAQLYELAVYFAPESAEASIRGSLEVYSELGIEGRHRQDIPEVGTIGPNVARALKLLESRRESAPCGDEACLVLLFVGLRIDPPGVPARFPAARVEAARKALEARIDEELGKGGDCKPAFGIAAGASGGDLLFHEICRDKGIPTRLCLALRKPEYVGQYVAPAGEQWVERFSEIYRYLLDKTEKAGGPGREPARAGSRNPFRLHVFSDSTELPRWLQGKPLYNVGRRNNQWMLQHAIASAQQLGPKSEITLFALWDERTNGEVGIGGISDLTRAAAMQGIKVVHVHIPMADAAPKAASVLHAPLEGEARSALLAADLA